MGAGAGLLYSVCVGRAERSAAPSESSIRLRALNPESSAGNCTPIPGVLEAPPPDGLTQTTLPATGILVGSSSSVRIRYTSSPSWYWRLVRTQNPPVLTKGMKAADSAAFSSIEADNTPARAAASPP